MRRAIVMTTVFVLMATVAACGSSSKNSTSPTTGASGPKASGTVTLLTHDAFAASKEVLAEFTAQSGYKVELVKSEGDAGVVVNEAILRKDHPVADALFGVDNTFLTRALDAGIFVTYTPMPVTRIQLGVPTDPEDRVTPIDQGDVCINYDNTWFGRDGHPPAPTSLASLVDPRYKNLTVVENAATSSPGLVFLLATIVASGEQGWQDYWKQLRKNGVRVVDDWTAAYLTDFTAGSETGDRPIVVSYGSSPPADVVGSSPPRETSRVGVVPSTCFRQYEFAGVLDHAANPEGAKALIDFMLTRRFQEDMPLQMYVNPVIEGAQLPAVYAKWAVVPPHPYTMEPEEIGAHRDTWIKEWTDIAVR